MRKSYKKDSIADVFFLHPTSFTDVQDSAWNADIRDKSINDKTDNNSILYQASAFAEKTRVFAPRYRQANIKAYFSRDSARSTEAFQLAYNDVRSAFQYYLKYYNNGRPVIIAAHSQGTTHAVELIKEFFEGKKLMSQLVCAYLIGMPVPENYFTNFPVCSNADKIGCFMSWRTYQSGYIEPKFVASENFKAAVTNPLTWDTTQNFAPASLNKGGVLRNFNKVIKNVTDARIKGNVLWSSKPKFFGNIFLQLKNYHIADINFFYVNIGENLKNRLQNYLTK